MGRLFGTDGVRGIANSELSCEFAVKIGRAAATVLMSGDIKRPRVMIGKDTRISSDMLESAIAAGLCSVGADVVLVGVAPTPAVAYLVKREGCDAGIMISASHNTCEYNGIKIFKSDGYKLPDELEEKIEELLLDETMPPTVKIGGEVGKICSDKGAISHYIDHIRSTAECDFGGLRVAFDCANGSASVTARKLFTKLGADCRFLCSEPDGTNINAGCGSTHLERLQKYVVDNALDAGFAFDGDADRLLAVDADGNIIDGDMIIALCSKHMKEKGVLNKATDVEPVMSNMGYPRFCGKNGIAYERTKVGDRYVLENMVENGYSIGGEQSGHVIFLDYASTGDGQLTAVQIMNVMKQTGKPLSELAAVMEVFPQIMINVKVSNIGKVRCLYDEEIKKSVSEAEKELGSSGRVLVRVSGTEPLVRVMLEGSDGNLIKRLGEEIAEVIRERLI